MVVEPDLFELPSAVRERVIALAARGLGLLPPTDVPPRLRSIARFAPRRRAELGAGPLARALADDAVLRRRLSEVLELLPAASSPVADTAGAAQVWLARPAGWVEAVGHFLAGAAPESAAVGRDGADSGGRHRAGSGDGLDGGPDRLDGLDAGVDSGDADTGGHAFAGLRAGPASRSGPADPPDGPLGPLGPLNGRQARPTGRRRSEGSSEAPVDGAGRRLADQLATARAEVRVARETARREVAGLRGELAAAQRTARAAVDRAADAAAAAEVAREQAENADREFRSAERRSRRRLEELTADLAAARRDVRAVREVDDARLQLLLETLGGAVDGIARELALPSRLAVLDPVDTVESREPAAATDIDARASSWADPGTLGRFLSLPRAHLIVDGYNVTKAALPTLPLARQRELLVRNLAGLAAQTGAEITIVFDGADVTAVPVVGSRGIRVRFSPLGVSADAVIRAMARAEPPGRPVVVVSSDREVAEGVRRSGATAVGSTVLVRRLLGG